MASPGDRFVSRCRSILEAVKKGGSTAYRMETCIDEEKGAYIVNCSKLVQYVLEEEAPEHLTPILAGGTVAPRAKDFHAFFSDIPVGKSRHGWLRLPGVSDARPGDVLAYRNTHDDVPGTGHIMFVYPGPVETGETFGGFVGIPVFDSAFKPHGDREDVRGLVTDFMEDSRSPPGGPGSGVGVGRMWFGEDSDSYCWSSPFGNPRSERIAAVRPVEM